MRPPLLIVDDDPLIIDSLSYLLGRDFDVRTATNRSDAVDAMLISPTPVAALIDLGLPPSPHMPNEGFALISDILAHSPNTRIIVLSGQSDEANARHARALGATEFAAKPANPDYLRQLITRVVSFKDVAPLPDDGQIGTSLPMQRLKLQLRQFADSPFPVLIEGESGTGKELVAAGLHRSSKRHNAPYLPLNCAAIAPNLVEATLFGHSKGAFTGATTAHAGYFEEASEGSLFLDEIGELPLDLQPKLLRVLENGEFQRVGETAVRKSSARIIAATNRDLRSEVKAGRFRADLFHRLSVFSISVPPLRERGDDALLLLNHFLDTYSRQTATGMPRLNQDAAARLIRYSFPGNVRELRNIAIRLCAKHPDRTVAIDELETEFDLDLTSAAFVAGPASSLPERKQRIAAEPLIDIALRELRSHPEFVLEVHLREIEAAFIQAAQQLAEGNLAQAARLLGLNRTTLYNRMDVVARNRKPS
jgi:two-component system nitrogen regulation response regulator GlnG